MFRVYLDHMATTPLDREVLSAMLPYLENSFGNPSRPYDLGSEAKDAMERSRESVARLINASPEEIIFTSSGAEANNLAVRGLAKANSKRGMHLVTSEIEHHSTLNAFRALQKAGFVVTFLPVNSLGEVSVEKLESAITERTTLVSVMLANYEVGTLQAVREIAEIAHEKGALVHTDAVAAAGNVEIDVKKLGVDALSLSAHTMYGPKGVGALYLREGLRIVPLIYSGIQEEGRRGGTENVAGIVGFGKAAELARRHLDEVERVRWLRDKLIEGVLEVEKVELTGHAEKRLPNHASFIVESVDGEALMMALSFEGIYIGNGTACISQVLRASPILLAMGYPPQRAQCSAIFTLGRKTSKRDIEYVLSKFPGVVEKLRKISPLWDK
ncbi:MAG: cysteine desulfurase [Euryarchaeota archaeon]|nr:cysteine desulfurase [Euryarchaeota archaeon]